MDNITNNSIIDSVGFNHGTIFGNASLTEGIEGKGLHFDGDDRISIPDDQTLDEKLNEVLH